MGGGKTRTVKSRKIRDGKEKQKVVRETVLTIDGLARKQYTTKVIKPLLEGRSLNVSLLSSAAETRCIL